VKEKWSAAVATANAAIATASRAIEVETWDGFGEESWLAGVEGGIADVTRRKRGSQERIEEWDGALSHLHHRTMHLTTTRSPSSPPLSLTPLPFSSIKRFRRDDEQGLNSSTSSSKTGGSELSEKPDAREEERDQRSWRSVFDEVGEERECQEQLRSLLEKAVDSAPTITRPTAHRNVTSFPHEGTQISLSTVKALLQTCRNEREGFDLSKIK